MRTTVEQALVDKIERMEQDHKIDLEAAYMRGFHKGMKFEFHIAYPLFKNDTIQNFNLSKDDIESIKNKIIKDLDIESQILDKRYEEIHKTRSIASYIRNNY